MSLVYNNKHVISWIWLVCGWATVDWAGLASSALRIAREASLLTTPLRRYSALCVSHPPVASGLARICFSHGDSRNATAYAQVCNHISNPYLHHID